MPIAKLYPVIGRIRRHIRGLRTGAAHRDGPPTAEWDLRLPQDAFYLVSYPRSGNTWLLNSLVMLLGAVRAEARSSFRHYPHLYGEPDHDCFFLRAEHPIDMSRPLAIKSHDTYDVYESLYPKKKCIYLHRDGRDALLSYYFYTKAFGLETEVIFERIGRGRVLTARTPRPVRFEAEEFANFLLSHTPEWACHVGAWLEADGVFTLSYEELHVDFADRLAGICAYLQTEPVVTVAEVEKEYGREFKQFLTGDPRHFFRKGIIGDWQNYFSPEHARLFAEAAGDLLVTLGYD